MFDITTVREVPYGAGETTYAYQDHEDKNLWYLVPQPQVRIVNGSPAITVVKYKSNGGGIAGLCTVEAELVQSPEAKAAFEAQIGHSVDWGGFTWVGGSAFLYYDIEGEAEAMVIEPTLYGTNVAAFQIPLDNQAALNTFVTGLSQGGGMSPFRFEYDMLVLTNLLGAEATVKYDSEAAISYEGIYETRSSWGQQKQVLVGVKEILEESGAGHVEVKEGTGATPELMQRVRDWAWTTLENQVAQTIAAAAAMANGATPVSASTSFIKTYSESVIVDWSTPVSRFIPKFSPAEWDNIYTEVDNRTLSTTFSLIGQLTRNEDSLPIAEKVTITVSYPTRTTDNTFELIVTDGDKSSHIYDAPGDFINDKFNAEYNYKFVVKYDQGGEYDSGWIKTNETLISITPSDFGTRQVAFIGQGVPFKSTTNPNGTVDKVLIDFFFGPPSGNVPIIQTKELNGNGIGNETFFDSYFAQPIGAAYYYKLRYMMVDNSVITSAIPIMFSEAPGNTLSGNADVVYVVDPKDLVTEFALRSMTVKGTDPVAMIDLTAQYWDPNINKTEALHQNTWNAWTPDGEKFIDTALPTWNFQAVDNANVAYFKLLGSIFYADGSEFQLQNYMQPATKRQLTVNSAFEYFSIEVITDRIDWTMVESVQATFFQLDPKTIERLGDRLQSLVEKLPFGLTAAELDEINFEDQLNQFPFNLMNATEGQSTDDYKRHYNIAKTRKQGALEFYYTVRYYMKGEPDPRSLVDQKVTGELFVNLPPYPAKESEPGIVHQVIDADALAASYAEKS